MTDVQPIPKPEARHEDPRLLRYLKEAWQEFGCAICGRPTAPTPPDGFDVELHHIIPRSQGGGDYPWNIAGLCGELTEQQCHHMVTTNQYEIRRNDQGFLVWRDRRAGGQLYAALRFIPEYSQLPPAGALAASNGDDLAVEPGGDTDTAPASRAHVPADPQQGEPPGAAPHEPPSVPGAAPETISPDDPPLARAQQIRDRVTAARRLTMEAAILLQHAEARGDHHALGVSWTDYYGSLGLERATVSKMLAAGRALGAQWQALTPTAREQVSLEQAYQGSLLVKTGWSADDAMDAVVSHPTAHLIALRTGDEPSERCQCECPKCGRELWHDRASQQRGAPEKENGVSAD